MKEDGPASAWETRTFRADSEAGYKEDSTGNRDLQQVAQVRKKAVRIAR
jgi:hypothetical protein